MGQNEARKTAIYTQTQNIVGRYTQSISIKNTIADSLVDKYVAEPPLSNVLTEQSLRDEILKETIERISDRELLMAIAKKLIL